jgi:hypothetical protein
MRIDTTSDRRQMPRWALWLVAVVCFGPLTLMWLLAKSWRFLLARSVRPDVERRSRLRREHRDDWRLDA